MAGQLHALSPAKINLSLNVLGRRADGYHDILTVMQKIDLADEIDLSLSPHDGIRIHCDDPAVPTDSRNLMYRAAERLLTTADIPPGVEISLKKRIPVAAGLGGGSSDAATVMKLLNEATGLHLGENRLVELGAGIGSDVPFFISTSVAAIATGRGEKIEPISITRPYVYLLVCPPLEVSTAWAYESFDGMAHPQAGGKTGSQEMKSGLENGTFWSRHARNDLESATAARHPEILEIKNQLLRNGALYSAMSGSGPSVFGVFNEPSECQKAFSVLRSTRARPSWIIRGASDRIHPERNR